MNSDMKAYTFLSFMTRAPIESRDFADKHLSIWGKYFPAIPATRFLDANEKQFLVSEFREQFYDEWAGVCTTWVGEKKRMYGSKDPACKSLHGTVRIYTKANGSSQTQYTAFMKEWAAVSVVDLATLVVFNEEVPEPERTLGAFYAVELPYGLPAVPWAACFGKPYIEMFSREKLDAAPFAVREWLSDDLVYCQLTENCFDYVNNHSSYLERQEAVMQILGRDCFRDAAHPSKRVRVPVFPGLDIPAPTAAIPFPPAIALSDSKREI